MISRRTFSQLAGTAAVGAFVAGGQPAPASAATAPPTVTESDTEIQVDNGPVQLVVDKSNGRATGIRFGGQNLVGAGGRGNYDMNNAREGAALPLPPADNGFAIRQQDDFVDVVFGYSPTDSGPFWLERHHILRGGEPGIHLANTFHHTADLHGFRSDQHRYVFYLNRDIFTHGWVGDDPIGVRWRSAAAELPTPDDLANSPMVMDATHDLQAVGSRYARRYYTKYDWAVYLKDHKLHGLYGNGLGIWLVLPNKEAFSGGPVRQDLTLHQTADRPVLLVEPQATHYGSPPVRVAAGQEWRKTYGPYFVYFAQGDDPARMRAEALSYGGFGAHAAFYDRLALSGWSASTERAAVTGRVRIPGARRMNGAVAVLSDNGAEFQRTALGHCYWADVEDTGDFRVRDVRPGTYRLTIHRPGVWGEYVQDDVVVTAARTLRLGDLTWRPVGNGQTVFQIGTPNRTSVEFHNGSIFRQYGLFQRYATEFPDGVTYTVGKSTNDDWNYVQYQRPGGPPAVPEGSAVVPPGTPGVWLFDCGGAGSPVAAGYTRLANSTVYSAGLGYGLDHAVDFRDRGAPDSLRGDFLVGGGYTFTLDVPAGSYDVTVLSGDAIAANRTTLSVQGGPEVTLSTATAEYAVHRTTATVSDGTLVLAFGGDGRANAIEVTAAGAAYSALSDLSVAGFGLTPAFSRFRSDYVVEVPYDVTSLEVTTTDAGGSHTRTVELTANDQTVELVTQAPGAAPATYRLRVRRQQAPWRIRFDLAANPGSVATLTIAIAAWAMDTARDVPGVPSNLTITLNGDKQVWTFDPDETRGATYRSGCGGRTFRREFRFDSAILMPAGNEIVLRLNEGTPPQVGTEVAYDAIRLEIGD
ncbi:polysaccharide lyase family protein [Flindersiella endophytica]